MKFISILLGSVSALSLSQAPNNFAQVYKDTKAKFAGMDETALANLAKEKTAEAKKAPEGGKKESTPEKDAEQQALEEALGARIADRLLGPGYYGYWGGIYGFGYPGYYPSYHPANYPTGEPMASVYPYYPMDSVDHINALKAYHDAVIVSGIVGQAAPTQDTIKKVLDIVTDQSKKDDKKDAPAKK